MNFLNPWTELERVRSEMDSLFNRYTRATPWRLAFLPGTAARTYPRLNVAETDNGYVVDALAPGVDPNTFDLSVRENVLSIAGEKKAPIDVSAEEYHRSERSVGKFVRTVQLPDQVDPDTVKATYAEGILTISMEKSETAKPRQITVEVG